MIPGYREVIEGRTEGRREGFIGRSKEKASKASTLSSPCYWITILLPLPQCPPGQASSKMHCSVRVVCQTISGRFDQSEASLARVGNQRAAEGAAAVILLRSSHQRPSSLRSKYHSNT
jgi:hypothetical protein